MTEIRKRADSSEKDLFTVNSHRKDSIKTDSAELNSADVDLTEIEDKAEESKISDSSNNNKRVDNSFFWQLKESESENSV